jgi:hypothetical protein
MKRERVIIPATRILLFCLMLTTTAFSQTWDGKWFELRGKAHGYVVDETGDLRRANFSGASYIFFHWNSANHRYDLGHWVENADGDWVSFNGILPSPIGNDELLWRDIYTRLQNGDNWIWVYATTRVKVKDNESGVTERAWFVAKGCESPMGSIDGQNFGGRCKLKGKMIDPADLPFVPSRIIEESGQAIVD